ncbi:hypothetical protein CU098_001551, partial [Rhizopus stolonifer]
FDLPPNQPPANNNDNDIRSIPQTSTNQFKPPRILDYGPFQGQEGDTFHINFTLQQSLDPSYALRIAFDSCFTTCHFSVNPVTQVVTLHTTVPNSNVLTCTDLSRVPVYLIVMQQEDQKIIDSWLVGYFSYYSRKRASTEYGQVGSAGLNEETKRSRSDHLQQPSYTIAPSYSSSSSNTGYYGLQHAPYVGLPPTQPSPRQREYFEDPTLLSYYRSNDPTSNFESPYGDTASSFMGASGSAAPMLATQTQPSVPPTQPQSTPQEAYNLMPILDTASISQQHPPSLPSSSTLLPSPTSNLQMKPIQPPLSSSSSEPYPSSISPTSTGANPFANLLNKANLRIEGNLEDMLKYWTAEEWENQRRLVQFWRRQEGNEVTCKFDKFTLPLEKSKQPDMNKIIVVSCIYWKEKDDYFITSVDCIYLLENLIGVKFTVEEKNRIRRNLEGYRPLTVSKMKPESADFFKLIMGFPNPKPRNIEKDVKVFPWTTLGVALKKIISKYTASYSSTASVNYDVLSSTTASGEYSQQQQ